ncbi:uncharacterized protein LOC125779119 isoform X2 [Bactrocera dorsalis]|uniref:Uncharacterized protein LOC125779119 isoform X2 n=1 Tax=Bactrocera dorsalis TaxID=27457 RepID=A0ABM3K2E5_BACDO|nr:uncharacterized protein LOC125779119 isoform X2 [Bactrocera dorsalis]
MSQIQIITSNKGGKKLFLNGYFYYFERKTQMETCNWACSKRLKYKCKSRIVTKVLANNHVIVKQPADHCHEPAPNELPIATINNKVKRMARRSHLAPSQIIQRATVEAEQSCRDYLPSRNAQKARIRRSRQEAPRFREPQTLEDIDIPLNLYTLEGELFVLVEKFTERNECVIICGTKSCLKFLSQSSCWIVDGTFYVAPKIMRQLFTIHGIVLFEELFRIASEYGENLQPERIISDFEVGLISALRNSFPGTDLRGCFFHFSQIIWRKVQKERLVKKYGNYENFSLQVRMLKSLAFVPPDEISEYYNSLCSILDDYDMLRLANWFERNYIGKFDAPPKHQPTFWSVHRNVETSQFPRTQNSVEAWHRRLNVIVGKKNCGIYQLIANLKAEMIYVKSQISRVENGEVFPKKLRSIRSNKQIKRIIKKE